MKIPFGTILGFCIIALLWGGGSASAQAIGKVTSAVQGATVTREGSTKALGSRASISSGDLIKTNATGQVQIAFIDRTRIVVGSSSEFLIEDVTISTTKKASRFAVKAVGGTFRFLSGRSSKDAYELRTPTTTMGVRGTEFDFTVDDRRLTKLVTFSGQVNICTSFNACAQVSGGCAVITASRTRLTQPKDERAKKNLLREDFPFIVSQESLNQDYRVRVESCGDLSVAVIVPKNVPQSGTDRPGDSDRDSGYSEAKDEL